MPIPTVTRVLVADDHELVRKGLTLLLTAEPDFIELFLQIGRIGRALGIHLLLASQRIEGGKLRGLDTYLSYRIGLRTFSEQESAVILETPDAFHLPPVPGYGYLKVDTTTYQRFKAAYVSGALPATQQHLLEEDDSWFDGMESAFRVFGGVPREVLLDNAKALILHHDPSSREVVLHPRLHAFAGHWRFRVRACAPYRARTKGKDERGVGYVKSNAIAGRRFASWSELEAHLEAWTREVADVRVHGTTGETPIERFARDEASALRPLAGTPPFVSARDLLRRVGADCAVEVDGNAYSVPWRLIGERVRVTVGGGSVRVLHAGCEVALHAAGGLRPGSLARPAQSPPRRS